MSDPFFPESVRNLVSGYAMESFSTSVNNPTPTEIASIFIADGITPPPLETLTAVAAANAAPQPWEVTEYTLPARPDTTLLAFDTPEPELSATALPEYADEALPDDPSYYAVSLPDAPALEIPAFSAIAPRSRFDLPSLEVSCGEEIYSSATLDAVKARLMADVAGGSGIAHGIESAIWERERERLTEIVGTAATAFGNLGLAVDPPRLDRYEGFAVAESGRQQTLSHAEAEQKNREASQRQALELESALLSFASQAANRVLKIAVLTAESSIALYEAAVTKYNGEVAAFRAQAGAYDAQVTAQRQKVEVFKAQVDAMGATNSFNRALVETHKAQTQALDTTVRVYQSRMDAAKAHADMQAQRIDVYRARIDAYVARLRAILSAAQLREAVIRGESAKVEVFRTQVEEYRNRVQELSAYIQTRVDSLRLTVDSYTTLQTETAASLDALRADVGAEQTLREVRNQSRAAAQEFNGASVEQVARMSTVSNRGTMDLAVAAYQQDMEAHLATMQQHDRAIDAEGRLLVGTVRQLASAMESVVVAAYGRYSQSVGFTESYTAENIDYGTTLETKKAEAMGEYKLGIPSSSLISASVAGI
jgi:hypothetical protein